MVAAAVARAAAPAADPAALDSEATGAHKAAQLTPEEERRAEAIARYATGVALELRRDLDGALEQYLRSLQLDPHNAGLAIKIGNVFLGRKENARAVEILEATTKANPNAVDAWFWLGLASRAADQPQKATAAMRQVLKLNPMRLDATATLVEISLERNATADAVKVIDQASRQSSTDAMYWAKLGDMINIALKRTPALAGQIEAGRAEQCYEKALKLAPADIEIMLRMADVYQQKGDLKKSAELLQKVAAAHPDRVPLRIRLAQYYITTGEKAKAAVELEAALKREPQNFQLHNFLGEIYEELELDSKAVSDYEQSLVLKPDQLAVYLRITLLQLKQKLPANAFKTLATAKEKFPADFQVPYYYGLAYSDAKQFDKAITAFAEAEALVAEAPGDARLGSPFYFSYGAACERRGDFDKAVALFRKSIELDPKNDSAFNYLGYMWADKGINLDEAHEYIKKALEIEPDNGAYLDSLGWVLFKLGRTEEALPPLRRAAELVKEEDPVVFDHLADVLLKLGKKAEALDHLRRAIKYDPQNKDLAEKYQKLSGEKSETK